MKSKRIFFCCLSLVLFLFPGLAFSQWSTNSAENTAAVIAPDDQGSHKIIHDGHGGYFVVWHDYRDRATAAKDIYAQYFNAQGEPQWGADGTVVCKKDYFQEYPKVTLDGMGGIIISWEDNRGAGDYDIYVQRLDASGTPQWAANGIPVIATTDNDYCGWLVSDGAGGAILVSDNGALNRVTAAGTTLADTAIPLRYSTSEFISGPKLMADGAGGAFITWEEGGDVAVQRVYKDGTWWSSGYPVMLTNHGLQADCPRIIPDGSGGAIVMWQDKRDPIENDQIYAQRVNGSGVVQWATNGIQVTAAFTFPSGHGLAADGAGGAFVTWIDESDMNLYAQRVGHDGSLLWANDAQLTTARDFLDTSDSPRKTVEDGNGGFITVWKNESENIMAQRVNGNGTALWTPDGVVLSNADSGKGCPRIEGNGQGGAVAIWTDDRSSAATGQDIYMQAVSASGSLGDPGSGEPQSDDGGSDGGCFIKALL